jgi:hypothetical protein
MVFDETSSRESLLKGRLSTVDLLAITSLDELQTIFTFYKTSYLDE